MVVELTERVCQYCQLQMAACLTMRSEEQAVIRERQRFSEIAQFKTFSMQRRLYWLAKFVAHTSYVSARVVADTQTHGMITVTLAHALSVNKASGHTL